jgi:hypothetical protein
MNYYSKYENEVLVIQEQNEKYDSILGIVYNIHAYYIDIEIF